MSRETAYRCRRAFYAGNLQGPITLKNGYRGKQYGGGHSRLCATAGV
ncbi:MAG: hypothetical protein LBG74_07385 [Spirochaetaceae bacterium]|nr:hypothetical protein [Spirochaetaceae bacterium]